jgi:hypothetical protein
MPPAPRRSLGLAAALLLAATTASAGSRITTWTSPGGRAAYADSFGPHHLPLPEVAQRLSARTTAIPFACGTAAFALDVGVFGTGFVALGGYLVATAGIIAGPTTGYTYGGIPARGAVGAGVRLALVVGVPVAVAVSQPDHWDDEDELAALALGMLAGTGLAAVSGVWDIATVPGNVERNNRHLLQQARLRVEPAMTPFAHAPGVAVRIGFGSGGS